MRILAGSETWTRPGTVGSDSGLMLCNEVARKWQEVQAKHAKQMTWSQTVGKSVLACLTWTLGFARGVTTSRMRFISVCHLALNDPYSCSPRTSTSAMNRSSDEA